MMTKIIFNYIDYYNDITNNVIIKYITYNVLSLT